ncbi:hypothetical protein [Saccharobesus litoralis]|uniref:hypothetical protein n=1 Tax=Saccharobesus litoralis TaxID=2172099 RepID=UPI00131EDACF|nr:hypothetical protein [Saccharobesus litoralis]
MMKIMQTTQYLSAEDAESIIQFLDDIRAMLVASYGEEIRQYHRSRLQLEVNEEQKDE